MKETIGLSKYYVNIIYKTNQSFLIRYIFWQLNLKYYYSRKNYDEIELKM